MNRHALTIVALGTLGCAGSANNQGDVTPDSGTYALEYSEASGSCADAAGGYVTAYEAALSVNADGSFGVVLDTSEADADTSFDCPAQSEGTRCTGSFAFDTTLNVGGEDVDATLTWSTSVSRLLVLSSDAFDMDLTTAISCEGSECGQSDLSLPCESTQTYLAGLTGP